MKNICLTLLTVFVIQNQTHAQLTLTKNFQEPVVGDVYTYQEYDSAGVIPKSTGINQNWNFSTLNQTTINAVSNYVAASSVPSASNFPGATLAENTGAGQYNFYKSSTTPTTQYEYLGTIDVGPPAGGVKYSNSLVNFIWPLAPGNTFTDTFSGTLIGSSGSVNGTHSVTSSGSGSITLPGGKSYDNIVQIKTNDRITASITVFTITMSFTTTTIEYLYYHPTQKFPLLTVSYEINDDGTFTDTTVTIKLNKTITVGLRNQSLDETYSVFPNPANEYFEINLSNKSNQKGSISIYSPNGQLVKFEELGNAASIEKRIEIQDLEPGIYFIKTSLGNQSSVKKLIVE